MSREEAMNSHRPFPLCGAGLALITVLAAGPIAAEMRTQLQDNEITALVVGRTMVWQTDLVFQNNDASNIVRRSDGAMAELAVFLRTDGSMRRRCATVSRNGSRQPCSGIAGDGDIGVWEIKNDALCFDMAFRKGITQCFAIDRAEGRHRLRQVVGPRSTSDGSVFEVR